MDIAEVIGGILLLIIGVLCVVPLPLDGWFYGPTPEISMIGLVAGIFLIILGFYLIVSGFRSKKKAKRREVAGVMCIILSFLVCFTGLIAESEFWTRVFLIFGVGFLVVGIGLVGIRTKKKQP